MNAPDFGPPAPEAERDLVDRLKRGDRSAAGVLFTLHGDFVYRTAILPRLPVVELAEEVLRDTFRLALERIDQFEPQGTSIRRWLCRIAANLAISVQRGRKRTRDFERKVTPEMFMATPPLDPNEPTEIEDTRVLVQAALDRLLPKYALALRLRLIEDRPALECAAEMGVTANYFSVLLHRACKAFRLVYPP